MLRKIKVPLLLVLALIIIVVMLRLAVWQLDRAEQKQIIVDQVATRSTQEMVPLQNLIMGFDAEQYRYRQVSIRGRYLADKSIYVDNRVFNGQVGYLVFTPLLLSGVIENGNANHSEPGKLSSPQVVMVNRGWISVGQSRAVLPSIETTSEIVTLVGRLNKAPSQPPLWNDKYEINQGLVWAYLPLNEYASQMQLMVLPLVVELASNSDLIVSDPQFKIAWSDINDEWVAKHQGYAFQWFMMALAFFVACLVLVLRFLRAGKNT